MKVFIGLALLSVAFATPLAPVSLPKPPAPAFETFVEVPKAEMPIFQMPDIRPLIIPQEVMEALMAAAPVNADSLVDAVIVVENANEVAPLAEDIVDPVRFVEVAENQVAEVPLDLSPVNENAVHGDGVIVVDHFDIRPEPRVQPDQVVISDEAYDIESSVDEESPVEIQDIDVDAVRIVDAPIPADSDVVANQYTVKVVDAAIKQYENPMWR